MTRAMTSLCFGGYFYLTDFPGHYVMVVGQLQQNGDKTAIRCLKVQNLSDKVVLPPMWPLEVIEALKYL